MADDLIGLDPGRVRDLAESSRAAGHRAGEIADDVAGILFAAALADNGFDRCCREIDEELDLLASTLDAAAAAMEAADGASGATYGHGLAALWASLSDGVGAGFDPEADPTVVGAGVPMSTVLAATTLAGHADGAGGGLGIEELGRLAADETRPMAVRAAALAFVLDPELWLEIPVEPGRVPTGAEYRRFAEQTMSLAVLAAGIRSWTNASGDEDGGDIRDDISLRDLEAVADDDSGSFTEAERTAAAALRSDATLWDLLPSLTLNLVRRRAFGEHPGAAETYTNWAGERAEAAIDPLQWSEDEPIADWVRQSAMTATDTAQQAAVVRSLTHLRLTVPPPEGLERERQVLEVLGVFDPSPVSDVLIAGTHAAEGHYASAVTEGVGGLLPGAFDRLLDGPGGNEVVERATERIETAHDLADAATSDARERTDPTPIGEIVDIATDEFGPYAGQIIREQTGRGQLSGGW